MTFFSDLNTISLFPTFLNLLCLPGKNGKPNQVKDTELLVTFPGKNVAVFLGTGTVSVKNLTSEGLGTEL